MDRQIDCSLKLAPKKARQRRAHAFLLSLTNSCGSLAGPKSRSRVQCRGRGSKIAVAGPKSRSRVQCRGRGKWFGVRGNWVKTTDMKKNMRGKNRFYAWYSTVANLQVTDVRVNKLMSQEKTYKKKLADFCIHRKFILFSFYRAQLCINSALNVLMHSSIW